MIKGWMDNCKEHHESCKHRDAWVPTRLIDVGTDEENVVKLVQLPRDEKTQTKYATLSYLRGPSEDESSLKTLTEEHMEEMTSEMEVSDLAASFRDAFTVCRALGIRYLWIDALCIIQDSPEDCEREATQAYKVFRHSEFTIVA